MKTTLFILIALFLISMTGITAEVKVTKVVFKCPEVSCAGCQKHISESVNTLAGIKSVKVDLDTKLVTVEYDDSKTTQEKIKAAIEEAGYEAEAVS